MLSTDDPGLARRAPLGRGKKLVLALSVAVLALALGELALASRPENRVYRVWPPGLRNVFRPRSDLMPGISGDSRFEIDALGFRADGAPAQDALRILALGGSTTECLYLDQAEAWPALVQERLTRALGREAWVANAGKSGRTTSDHELQVLLLDQETRFDVVLLLTGVNDLGARLAQDTTDAPELDRGARLRRAFDVLPLAREPGPFWRRLGTYRLLAQSAARWSGPPRVQDDAGAIYERWRAHRRAASAWRSELPGLASALERFQDELERIADACEARSVELVLVTQPALCGPDLSAEEEALLWLGGVGEFQQQPGAEYYTAAALARGLAAFNATLAGAAERRGIVCIDLAQLLGRAPELFYDDVHFNEEGARRTADVIAAELLARVLGR